ncbi:hypothetical protein B0T26DRAFT_829054 [Lasiosphaeria miniovina]|uniref:Rhodopsin domain-containing protein n=1 Tax=Lasiosphaeria miniovina TaxID=1954250 RepID=A0AA40DVL9_9PEZI|nr:uncharacterized protein B0T26DRAFT_829054 [Lasiosphaeria miniovina]KAK0717275.1 hypothetical protein B0T26DRAFT_829054 [Lasiosphaeria miniovina]
MLIGVTALLHVFSLSFYAARIWTRVRPTVRLTVDDYLITAAVIFDLFNWAFTLAGVKYGIGRHNYYIAPDQEVLAEKWLVFSEPFFPWALACAKMSIAWMLLRIQRDRLGWAITMYALMLVSIGVAISANTIFLTMCKPIWALWDHSNPDAVCGDPAKAQISIYVSAGLTVFTDIVLSIAPITFIMAIQRPLREKLVLAFIMGLGLMASAASIYKTFKAKDYGVTGDTLMDTVQITLWSITEAQLAIIAACIPTLKQLFERMLRRVGVLPSTRRSGAGDSGSYPTTIGGGSGSYVKHSDGNDNHVHRYKKSKKKHAHHLDHQLSSLSSTSSYTGGVLAPYEPTKALPPLVTVAAVAGDDSNNKDSEAKPASHDATARQDDDKDEASSLESTDIPIMKPDGSYYFPGRAVTTNHPATNSTEKTADDNHDNDARFHRSEHARRRSSSENNHDSNAVYFKSAVRFSPTTTTTTPSPTTRRGFGGARADDNDNTRGSINYSRGLHQGSTGHGQAPMQTSYSSSSGEEDDEDVIGRGAKPRVGDDVV